MSKKIVNTPLAPAPVGAYNQSVVCHGQLLFLSGQIAINPESGELVLDDIETETEQVMHNIGSILQANGLEFDHVVKCSVFVKDMQNFARINEVYSKFFKTESAPARELVEVANLPKFVNVEISAIAVF